jgi:catecholate siderophore receptor
VDPRRIEPTWENVPDTSLLNPAGGIPFPGTGTTGTEVNATVDQLSAYAIDTMKIGHQWTALASLRYDHASSTYEESVPPTEALNADDAAVTWRAALVYQPRENGSIYVSSGTSFHPNIEQLSISSEPTLPASTKDVAVGKNFEVEVGTKWDLFDKRLQLSGALFWDEQTNPAPADLDDPLIDVLHGKERVRGIELGAVGRLTDKWLILLSYTLQDSAVISSSDPTMLGNPVLNCPKNMGSAWTTYELPWNFQIGAGMNAVSSRTADLATDPATGLVQGAGGYVIFNAMVKYHISKNVDLQANLDNISDKYYIDGVHPGHAVPGPGRTLYVSMNFKF